MVTKDEKSKTEEEEDNLKEVKLNKPVRQKTPPNKGGIPDGSSA